MISEPANTSAGQEPISARRTARYAAVGAVAGVVFPALASLLKMYALHLPIGLGSMLAVQQAEPVLWITDTAPFFLGLVAGVAGHQQDRLVQANKALVQREAELNSARANLEMSVLDRTRELDERNAQMRAVIGFARELADAQDLPSLLGTAVESLHDRFGRYEADLFLVDARGQAAVLSASSSADGAALVQSGRKVALGDASMVARVARRGKMLISGSRPDAVEQAPRVTAASGAPAQIVLPLTARGRVIGVLDLRQPSPSPVGQNEIDVLQLVADQLAASIESMRQTSEVRATVQQLESVTAEATRVAWDQYLRNNSMAYQFTAGDVRPAAAGEAANEEGVASIPLILRGQRIGSISLRKRAGDQLAPTEQDLMEKVGAQVALALENVRLLEETRRRAAQEQIISEISARFSRSLDVDALLQAAVREFAALPEVAEATVVLKPTEGQELGTPG